MSPFAAEVAYFAQEHEETRVRSVRCAVPGFALVTLGGSNFTSALPSGLGHISFGLSVLAVGAATDDDFPYAHDM